MEDVSKLLKNRIPGQAILFLLFLWSTFRSNLEIVNVKTFFLIQIQFKLYQFCFIRSTRILERLFGRRYVNVFVKEWFMKHRSIRLMPGLFALFGPKASKTFQKSVSTLPGFLHEGLKGV